MTSTRQTVTATTRGSVRRATGPVAAIAALVLLSGCSALDFGSGPTTPERDATGEIAATADADVFSIRSGDCIDHTALSDSETISSVPVVPCGDPHDGEVYFAYDLPDGPYPGVEEIYALGNDRCYDEFTRFVGLAYEESELDFWPMTPVQEGWEGQGDHEVLCILVSEGLVTGTMRDAAY